MRQGTRIAVGASGIALIMFGWVQQTWAQEGSSVVAISPKVSVAAGSSVTVGWLAPGGVLTVAPESDKVSAASGACTSSTGATADTSTTKPPTPIPVAPPSTLKLQPDGNRYLACITGQSVGVARVVALGSDGTSTVVDVTVTSASPTPTVAAPPASLQFIVVQDKPSEEGTPTTASVTPGFATPGKLAATAAGQTSSGYVALGGECASGTAGSSSDTESTTTTTSLPGTPVPFGLCSMGPTGTYTAKFDLNGADTAGGDLTVTVVKRWGWEWAAAVAALGALVAILFALLTEWWTKRNSDAAKGKPRNEANAAFEKVQNALGVDHATTWDPDLWEPLKTGSQSKEPTPEQAAHLYLVASSAAIAMQAAAEFYDAEVPHDANDADPWPFSSSIQKLLSDGVAIDPPTETPGLIASQLNLAGVYATAALKWGKKTRKSDAPNSAARLKRMAMSSVANVPSVIANPDAEAGPQGGAPAPLGIGILVPSLPILLSGARDFLASRWAMAIALIVGLLAAILVAMPDALNPSAAWGTPADFAKVFVAALALPALVESARKALVGSAPAAG